MPDDRQRELDAALVDDLLAQSREELVALASTIVRNRHEAEDVVQETFVAVWRRLADIDPDKLPHYLKRAVRQNAIKRRTRRRGFTELEAAGDALATQEQGPAGDIDPIDLEQAIASLPLSQQTVVRMKYFLGMTFRQIGVSLSISANTAASRCHYALVKLKGMLGR